MTEQQTSLFSPSGYSSERVLQSQCFGILHSVPPTALEIDDHRTYISISTSVSVESKVPWTAKRSNQFILKISPGISLEGMMLKLKLQYSGHLMRRVDSLEKILMLGGIGVRRRRGQQRMR